MNKKQKQEVLLQMNNIFELDAAGEVLGDADVVIFVDGSGLGARYIWERWMFVSSHKRVKVNFYHDKQQTV